MTDRRTDPNGLGRDGGPDPLVSSSDVNGTAVYSPQGDRVGEIDHLLIDKKSGTVTYAMMTIGGFLGLGQDEYPIPWKALDYDTAKGGFVTDISKETLEAAPTRAHGWRNDREWHERTFRHYGITPYWF